VNCPQGHHDWGFSVQDRWNKPKTRKIAKVQRICYECIRIRQRNKMTREKAKVKNARDNKIRNLKMKRDPEYAQKIRTSFVRRSTNACKILNDGYIRQYIRKTFAEKSLKALEIPDQLVEITRYYLQLNRTFNDKSTINREVTSPTHP
jgi:hypothetical protein